MPVKSKNTKSKINFARAKKKIKDVGVGIAAAVATMAPLKSVAQDRVVDAEAKRISVLVDTIRLGMTIENQSSRAKEFMIFDGTDPMILLDDALKSRDIYDDSVASYSMINGRSFDGTFKHRVFEREVSGYTSDGNGLFFTLASSAIHKNNIVDRWISKTEYTYAYNTDPLYDKYLGILGKQFSFAHTMPTSDIKIVIHCLDEYVKVSAYDRTKKKDKYGRYPLLGSMVVHAFDERIVGFSYDHEVFVFKTKDDANNYHIFDGESEKTIPINIVNKSGRKKIIRDYKAR